MVDFAADLIRIPTENPPGREYAACVERMVAECDALGLEREVVETGDGSARRQAIVARTGDRGPLLYLHGHYDVVPAFDSSQFRPRVEDGHLIGRGAADMKGGLAAILYAARPASERGTRVQVVIVPDEETGGRFGSVRLSRLGLLDASAAGAIVAEPTWGTIWHACRGALTLRVRLHGAAAHVGLHYEGRNAFAAAVDLAHALRPLERRLRGRRSSLAFASNAPEAAESIMLVGGVARGGTNFNIVPAEFELTIDRRPNADENYEQAKAELLAALDAARPHDFELDWEVLQDAPGALTPPDGLLPHALGTAVAQVTGEAPAFTCCPGVLETRVYGALGIPAVAFGPGPVEHMHAPDEQVPLANLEAAARIYVETAALVAAGT
jgi:acetylornithine deacetylase/succinyl-diaminopimelate desuccinylase-like protein